MSDHGEGAWAIHQFPDGYSGYAVELGALDGEYLSNTRLLEEKGWTVLCIEPNPTHHDALTRNRKLVLRCACDRVPAQSVTLLQMGNDGPRTHSTIRNPGGEPSAMQFGRVAAFDTTVLTLHQCLSVVGFPRLDLLSLDVDGIERDILAGIDLVRRWTPKVVIVEESAERIMSDALPQYTYSHRISENGCYVRKEA